MPLPKIDMDKKIVEAIRQASFAMGQNFEGTLLSIRESLNMPELGGAVLPVDFDPIKTRKDKIEQEELSRACLRFYKNPCAFIPIK